MKTKCKSLRLSIIISFLSFVLFTTFFFLNKCFECIWYEYFTNIFLGFFGSSFIVFLIAIPEYRVAKKQVLEKIWIESRKLNMQLYKIRPFYSKIDTELLVDYLSEWLFSQNDEDKLLYGNKHEAYDKMYSYFCKYQSQEIKKIPKDEKDRYINTLIENERRRILKDLEEIIDQYLNLRNYSLQEMNNLLGDVEFFTGKCEYKKLHANIYQPLLDMYNDLKNNICYHFDLYRNRKVNRIDVLFEMIIETQKKLFRVEKQKDSNEEWYIIYSAFCDSIEDKIEEFRAKTIYQCEIMEINHHPIQSNFCNLNEVENDNGKNSRK